MNVFDCLFSHYLSSDSGFSNFVPLIIFGFMSIQSDMPQIAALIGKVEEAFGIHPATHSEYIELVSAIESTLKEHVSESTLERLWGYSTRKNEKLGYDAARRGFFSDMRSETKKVATDAGTIALDVGIAARLAREAAGK